MSSSSKCLLVLGFVLGFSATGCGADTKPRVVADPIPDAASDGHVLPPVTSKTEAGSAPTCAESSRALTDSTCDLLPRRGCRKVRFFVGRVRLQQVVRHGRRTLSPPRGGPRRLRRIDADLFLRRIGGRDISRLCGGAQLRPDVPQ